jgi:long-chain acyl-CoA synthetase
VRHGQVVTFEEMMQMNEPLRRVKVESDAIATLVYTSGTTNKPKGVMLKHSNILHQVGRASGLLHDKVTGGAEEGQSSSRPIRLCRQVHFNSFSRRFEARANPCVADILVSVLPCWHIFERTAEYWMFSKGIHVVYSNIKNFKSDLIKVQPPTADFEALATCCQTRVGPAGL